MIKLEGYNKLNILIYFAIASLFLWIFSPVLLPFIVGIFIAYLLDPLVDYLEKNFFGRTLSTSIVLFFFIIIIFLSIALILPIIINQIYDFLKNSPHIIEEVKKTIYSGLEFMEAHINEMEVEEIFENIDFGSASILAKVLNHILSSSLAIFNTLGLVIITPVVSWYLLRDWDVIIEKIKNNIPKKYLKLVSNNIIEVDRVLSSFIRGQLLICLILSIIYSIGLELIGIKYSIVLGVFSGLMSFVPYLGTILGLSLSLLLGFLQFEDLSLNIYILLLYLFGQVIEGNYLTPKLIGEKLGLHPVVVLFSVFAAGSMFGFIGVFIAIPVASVLVIFLKKYFL